MQKRALEYCDHGDTRQAFASMASDLRKHPETRNHAAISLGFSMLVSGILDDPEEMRTFINGFN